MKTKFRIVYVKREDITSAYDGKPCGVVDRKCVKTVKAETFFEACAEVQMYLLEAGYKTARIVKILSVWKNGNPFDFQALQFGMQKVS